MSGGTDDDSRTQPAHERREPLPEWRSPGDRSPGRFARHPDAAGPAPGPPPRADGGSRPAGEPGTWSPYDNSWPGTAIARGLGRLPDHVLRRLILAAVLLLLTSPLAFMVDDEAGRRLGLRYDLPRLDPQGSRYAVGTVEATVATRPGEMIRLRASTRSTPSCAILDGKTWRPLEHVPHAGTLDLVTRMFDGRRGSFLTRYETKHEFLAVRPTTRLRCEVSRGDGQVQVWHDDTGRRLAYDTIMYGGRGLWFLGGTSVLWAPILTELRRRRREGAG